LRLYVGQVLVVFRWLGYVLVLPKIINGVTIVVPLARRAIVLGCGLSHLYQQSLSLLLNGDALCKLSLVDPSILPLHSAMLRLSLGIGLW
jgi:hypothetical protein